MPNEPTRGEIIARGAQAKNLMDNTLLSEAFETVLYNIQTGFLDSRAGDAEVLDLHKQAIAVKSVRGMIQGYISDAQMEEENKRIDEENR
jgi:hypothetical protein